MGKRLEAALDELRAAVFEAYAALAEEGAKTGTEQQRRESALQFIDEILESRPLATFSATHLELLEMLFAYWRETEVAEDAPIRASPPDGPNSEHTHPPGMKPKHGDGPGNHPLMKSHSLPTLDASRRVPFRRASRFGD